jgi:hypothetical protein
VFESVRHFIWVIAFLGSIQGTASGTIARDVLSPAGRAAREQSNGAPENRELLRLPVAKPKTRLGQHGGDLALLQSFYQGPRVPNESNHYFDLWEPGSLADFAAIYGLTNNHALIIDSHGTDVFSWGGPQYVFRPNRQAVHAQTDANLPTFSIRDVVRIMGRRAADSIHNVIIAGCNEAGALKTTELRRHFVNATNITYMTPGHLAYKPSFYQTLIRHSQDIEPLYGQQITAQTGQTKMEISRQRGPGSVLLGTYMADLYTPGANRPYRRQLAGRELLEPGFLRETVSNLAPPKLPTEAEPAADAR